MRIQKSLFLILNNAEKATDKESICSAVKLLEASNHTVDSQRGKKISDEAANLLIAYTNNVIAGLLAQLPPGETC